MIVPYGGAPQPTFKGSADPTVTYMEAFCEGSYLKRRAMYVLAASIMIAQ